MNRTATQQDGRQPRLLIPDTAPISFLAMAGDNALDWLFVPGIDVWITDMVLTEACREPDPGADQRVRHRAAIHKWVRNNQSRIHVLKTHTGVEYNKAMLTWAASGRRPDLKPSWTGHGDASILEALKAVKKMVADSETVVAIVDDRDLREVIAGTAKVNVDLLSTQSFIGWVADSGVHEALTAWDAIKMAAGGKVPIELEEDPLYVRFA